MKYIVVYGNAVDGLTFYGPFGDDQYEQVTDSLSMGADDTWTIAPIESVTTIL